MGKSNILVVDNQLDVDRGSTFTTYRVSFVGEFGWRDAVYTNITDKVRQAWCRTQECTTRYLQLTKVGQKSGDIRLVTWDLIKSGQYTPILIGNLGAVKRRSYFGKTYAELHCDDWPTFKASAF